MRNIGCNGEQFTCSLMWSFLRTTHASKVSMLQPVRHLGSLVHQVLIGFTRYFQHPSLLFFSCIKTLSTHEELTDHRIGIFPTECKGFSHCHYSPATLLDKCSGRVYPAMWIKQNFLYLISQKFIKCVLQQGLEFCFENNLPFWPSYTLNLFSFSHYFAKGNTLDRRNSTWEN